MKVRLAAPVVVAVALISAGCLGGGSVRPGPSKGDWSQIEGEPYFAYVRHVGFCGAPPCEATVVVFDDGRVLWFSWGTNQWDHGDGQRTGLHVPEGAPQEALEKALLFLTEGWDVTVAKVLTATLPSDDARAIEARVLDAANGAEDPGDVEYDCTDIGAPRVVLRADETWDVHVAPRDWGCGTNHTEQEAWFRIEEQGAALWDWVAPEQWAD